MKTTIKSKPLDFELCELLGETPADFIVFCFDGVQLDFFGTPYDSPHARAERQQLADRLNDPSDKSLWPDMWKNWKHDICRQFKLPDTTTSADYRPVVTCEISRVCAGYSEHLHAAIGLFEKVTDKITMWSVRKIIMGDVLVEIFAPDFIKYSRTGKQASLVIAETVCELLKANQANSDYTTASRILK
jgi:hypothetical protein